LLDPDGLTRSIARDLIEAGEEFRFELSDLQPARSARPPMPGMQGGEINEPEYTRSVGAPARPAPWQPLSHLLSPGLRALSVQSPVRVRQSDSWVR
jgi:hypothetical protein